jgi:hypothetical protein
MTEIAFRCPDCGMFWKEPIVKICPSCPTNTTLVRVLVFPDDGKVIHITTKSLENILRAFSKEITGDDYDFEARNFAWEKAIQKEQKAVKEK